MFNGHKPPPGSLHRPPLSPNGASSPQPCGEVSEMRLASPQHGPQTVIPCCRQSCILARTLGEHSVKQGLGVAAVRYPSQTRVAPTPESPRKQKDRNIDSRQSWFP